MPGIIFTVPQGHVAIIERFGRYARHHHAGLAFRLPLLESIRTVREWGDQANKNGWQIEITEQASNTDPRITHTKDNVELTASASVYWRINDPRAACYEVDLLPQSITDIALNALRGVIGTMNLDEALSNRQEVNDQVATQVIHKAAAWGVKISRVEVQELKTSSETSQAMLQQMSAERRQRALVSEAKGEAEAKILVAEAEKKAAILRAEGEAQALVKLAQADSAYLKSVSAHSSPKVAAQTLLAMKVLTGYEIISGKPAHKVFLPRDFGGLFSFPVGDADEHGAGPSRRTPDSPRPTIPTTANQNGAPAPGPSTPTPSTTAATEAPSASLPRDASAGNR